MIIYFDLLCLRFFDGNNQVCLRKLLVVLGKLLLDIFLNEATYKV